MKPKNGYSNVHARVHGLALLMPTPLSAALRPPGLALCITSSKTVGGRGASHLVQVQTIGVMT
jgi:hypothetical protein